MLKITVDGWDFSADQTMTPGEVAKAFGVDPKTVSKYGKTGKLASIRTPGGHRRFSRQQVEAIMHGGAP